MVDLRGTRIAPLPEDSQLPVLVYIPRFKEAPVHGDEYPRGEHLGKREGTAEVEQAVGAAEGAGDHCPRKNNGLVCDPVCKETGRELHGIRSVGDHDS